MTRAFGLACMSALLVAACAVVPEREGGQEPVATTTRSLLMPAPSSTVIKITDLKEVEARASKLPREGTLVVFDIDDTLLTTPMEATGERKFFGSDRWYVWQAYGLPPESPDKIGKCLFEVISTNSAGAKQAETQDDAMEILGRIPNDKLMLTSRSPDMKAATDSQLASVGYAGIPSLTSEPTPLAITVDGIVGTYDNGVFLTKGANKGKALVELLKTIERNYDYVILVDDTERNVLNMAISMALQHVNFLGLRYAGIKSDPPFEVSPEQIKAHRRDWEELMARYPDQASRWKAGQCQ